MEAMQVVANIGDAPYSLVGFLLLPLVGFLVIGRIFRDRLFLGFQERLKTLSNAGFCW